MNNKNKCLEKKKIDYEIYIVIGIIFLCVFGTRIKYKNEQKKLETRNIVTTSSLTENNIDRKINWGIKRGINNDQPTFETNDLQILQKYDGIAIGNKNSKNLYLTFDEGYESGNTNQILDILKDNDVKAAFFITGHYFNSKEKIVQRMIDEGHIVGNHTVNHKCLAELNEDEIKQEIKNLDTVIYEKFNYEMKYIRPPKGEFNEKSLNVIKQLGYIPVLWSFAYDDWDENNQKGEEYAKNKILSNMHNGAIILLHGNSKDNTNVLDFFIKEMKKNGYNFRSLEEFER